MAKWSTIPQWLLRRGRNISLLLVYAGPLKAAPATDETPEVRQASFLPFARLLFVAIAHSNENSSKKHIQSESQYNYYLVLFRNKNHQDGQISLIFSSRWKRFRHQYVITRHYRGDRHFVPMGKSAFPRERSLPLHEGPFEWKLVEYNNSIQA